MVSPMHPAEIHAATHIALGALGIPNDPQAAGSSVIPLAADNGYIVTVVQYTGELTAHVLHVDMEGGVRTLLGREV